MFLKACCRNFFLSVLLCFSVSTPGYANYTILLEEISEPTLQELRELNLPVDIFMALSRNDGSLSHQEMLSLLLLSSFDIERFVVLVKENGGALFGLPQCDSKRMIETTGALVPLKFFDTDEVTGASIGHFVGRDLQVQKVESYTVSGILGYERPAKLTPEEHCQGNLTCINEFFSFNEFIRNPPPPKEVTCMGAVISNPDLIKSLDSLIVDTAIQQNEADVKDRVFGTFATPKDIDEGPEKNEVNEIKLEDLQTHNPVEIDREPPKEAEPLKSLKEDISEAVRKYEEFRTVGGSWKVEVDYKPKKGLIYIGLEREW